MNKTRSAVEYYNNLQRLFPLPIVVALERAKLLPPIIREQSVKSEVGLHNLFTNNNTRLSAFLYLALTRSNPHISLILSCRNFQDVGFSIISMLVDVH